METACFSETLASIYETAHHQNPIQQQHLTAVAASNLTETLMLRFYCEAIRF
jgi:hypothetical protein